MTNIYMHKSSSELVWLHEITQLPLSSTEVISHHLSCPTSALINPQPSPQPHSTGRLQCTPHHKLASLVEQQGTERSAPQARRRGLDTPTHPRHAHSARQSLHAQTRIGDAAVLARADVRLDVRVGRRGPVERVLQLGMRGIDEHGEWRGVGEVAEEADAVHESLDVVRQRHVQQASVQTIVKMIMWGFLHTWGQ